MSGPENLLHPIRWLPEEASSILDIGCNVGDFLAHCRTLRPGLRLAGMDSNPEAVARARARLPGADLRHASVQELPFPDASFDCASCIEVLEHVPGPSRAKALSELRRVLRPGGRLILRVPHAGLFSFLDCANFRFMAPSLYRRFVGAGIRDPAYAEIVWHRHFKLEELLALAGTGWSLEARRNGGLLLFPLLEILLWPFYRRGKTAHWIFRALKRLQSFDFGIDYGEASYDILVALKRTE